MANFRTTIAANTIGTYLFTVTKPRALTDYNATIQVYGTFGGGTVTVARSTDGGTTKVVQSDMSGANVSITANGTIRITDGVADHNGFEPLWYVILAGATNPSLTIDTHDNT